MSGSFTVGALAAAAREANAVGAVRLTLLPEKLEIELLRAGSFRDGYVPGGLTRLVRFAVPYRAVRGLVRKGSGVLLSLDPRVATPHNRFFLTRFSDLPLESMGAAYKQRRLLRASAWLLPLPLALWAAHAVPPALVSGTLGSGSFACVVLALSALGLRALATAADVGGPFSARLRDALELRLAQRMGFHPAAFHETDPFELPDAEIQLDAGLSPSPRAARPLAAAPTVAELQVDPPSVEPTLPTVQPTRAVAPVAPSRPWPTPQASPVPERGYGLYALTAALGAAVAVLALVGGRLVSAIERAAPLLGERASAPPAEPEEEAPAGAVPASPESEACSCVRADSPLWDGGLPVLSVLTTPRNAGPERGSSDISPKLNKRGRGRYDFDVVIVNNGADPLKDVRLVLTFARRNEAGERVGATDRGLFWGGVLAPGRSAKWGVKAPGTEVRIDFDEKRLLGEVPAAPANAFDRLLSSQKIAVRLHAATMLAYLGDPRAEGVARAIGALHPADELTRERVVRAAQPLRVCDARYAAGALSVCAENTTSEAQEGLSVVEIDGAGIGRSRPIGEALPAKSGRRVRFDAFGGPAEELALRRPE